jgi:hypothetical protein
MKLKPDSLAELAKSEASFLPVHLHISAADHRNIFEAGEGRPGEFPELGTEQGKGAYHEGA